MKHALLAVFLFGYTLAAQPAPGTGSIEGRITNSITGAPVRSAIVLLNSPMIHLVAESDADGRFQFAALPPGTYALTSEHSGYFGHAARRPMTLADDDHISGAEVRLRPQAVITGRVLDDSGDPSSGARVSVLKQGYRNRHRVWIPGYLSTTTNEGVLFSIESLGATTNDAGEYRIEHLSPGRYLVVAVTGRPVVDNRYRDHDSSDHPRMVNVPVYYPNAAGQQMASPVAVAAGSELRGIDIRISRAPAYHVSGRLTGLPATFKNSVTVTLTGSDNASDTRTTQAVPPDYQFDLSVPEGQYALGANSGDGHFFGTAGVSVSRNVQDQTVPMSAPFEVSGRITLAERNDDVKLKDIGLYLLERSGNGSGWESSDAAGKYAFTKGVPPGRYVLEIDPKTFPESCFVEAIKVGGSAISGDFEIQSTTQIEVVLRATAGKITGSVTGENARPVPKATVTMIPSDGSPPGKAQVDENGSFQFSHLRPGAYTLYAWEEVDEDVWQDPEFLKQYEARATQVTVGPGESRIEPLKVIPLDPVK